MPSPNSSEPSLLGRRHAVRRRITEDENTTAITAPPRQNPPDSGAFVTPAEIKAGPAQLGNAIDAGLTVTLPLRMQRTAPQRSDSAQHTSSSATTTTTTTTTSTAAQVAAASASAPSHPQPPSKLSTDAAEFACFAIHRIWHRLPKPETTDQSQEPKPIVTSNGLVLPPGTAQWYPAFHQAVHKLIHHANCTLPHLLISLLYVARLRQTIPSSHSGVGSEFRVFVSAIILAQKYHTDDRYANKTWAKLSGLPLDDINTMEREFLQGLGGRLHVTREEYEKWLRTVAALGKELESVVKKARVLQGMVERREELDQEEQDLLRRVRTWQMESGSEKMEEDPLRRFSVK